MDNNMLGTDALATVAGPLKDFSERLMGEDGLAWFGAFKRFLRKENPWASTNPYLRLLAGGVDIAATDGKQTITEAKDVFTAGIDSDFTNWGLDKPSAATVPAKVDVYEQIQDGTFRQIFEGFGRDLDTLCLTQSQIIGFCQNHKDLLRTDGYGTFFLFKESGKFFVAGVRLGDGGRLSVCVVELGSDVVWSADGRHRFVVPQL